MKKTLLILAVVIVWSCKTENIYLCVFPQKEVQTITDTVYIAHNRFTRQFDIADSIFDKASRGAMRSASEKTKHFLPEWYKRKYID